MMTKKKIFLSNDDVGMSGWSSTENSIAAKKITTRAAKCNLSQFPFPSFYSISYPTQISSTIFPSSSFFLPLLS